jgi:hypothetical protein
MATPEPSFRLDRLGQRAKSGGSEVLMRVMRSLGAKIRKWLGLDKKPVGEPSNPSA